MLKGEIIISSDKREIIALIDIGGEKVFMSQFFIKEAQFLESDYVLIMMSAIDGYRISSYRVHDLVFGFIDSQGRK